MHTPLRYQVKFLVVPVQALARCFEKKSFFLLLRVKLSSFESFNYLFCVYQVFVFQD
jgi:hypothetical protein